MFADKTPMVEAVITPGWIGMMPGADSDRHRL
jgi:hypothetical protein